MSEASTIIERCRLLAACSEDDRAITRRFLSPPMHDVHRHVRGWMEAAGMRVRIDAAGNIRGVYAGEPSNSRRFYIGSHLDTVPNAGAFDGILGVVMGIAVVERLNGRRSPFSIEVIGFSEEEGVRFGVPFIGSRAFVGTLDTSLLARTDADGLSVADAIRQFGLDPASLDEAHATADPMGYLEIHIEQGPVLDRLNLPFAVVDAIVGQSRLDVTFVGSANHAGTTPMEGRRDAVAGAAVWISEVEKIARTVPGLVATVGRVEAMPGATNVIAAECRASLDVRHADDDVRREAVASLLTEADRIARTRGLSIEHTTRLDQGAVAMDAGLLAVLHRAAARSVGTPHVMTSGAGHDAMVVRPYMPAAMLFVRSPGGVSHHPDENVRDDDVAAALEACCAFVDELRGAFGS
jgi:allantoate deiminase